MLYLWHSTVLGWRLIQVFGPTLQLYPNRNTVSTRNNKGQCVRLAVESHLHRFKRNP